MNDLKVYIEYAKNQGWEGVMLINSNSYYESCRSHNLLKVKPQFDAEAEIIEHDAGKTGKNIGRLGCLKCKIRWNEKVTSFTGGKDKFIGCAVVFGVSGMRDSQREWDYVHEHYPVGKVIHFTFLGVTEHGTPFSCNIAE